MNWPVFSDPTHRRARSVVAWSVLLILASIFVLGSILQSLLNYPTLASDALRPEVLRSVADTPTPEQEAALRDRLACDGDQTLVTCAERESVDFMDALADVPRERLRVHAFLPAWPDWRGLSVDAHIDEIDVLMPHLYALDLGSARLEDVGTESDNYQQAEGAMRRKAAPTTVLPVASFAEDTLLERVSDERVGRMARALVGAVTRAGHDGVCIDTSVDPHGLYPLAARIAERLDASPAWGDRTLCAVVPIPHLRMVPEPTAPFDRVVLAPGREVAGGALPGPPTARSDDAFAVALLAERADRDAFVVALNTEALLWSSDVPLPQELSYANAMARVAAADAQVRFVDGLDHSTASFLDDAGRTQTIWFEDLPSMYPVVRALADAKLDNVVIWPLGGEDPGIWALVSDSAGARRDVVAPNLFPYVAHLDEGPFMGYSGTAVPGLRLLSFEDGDPVSDMLRTPSPHRITRWGEIPPLTILLTFDDGPDAQYTGEILDVLKETRVPATFFLVGSKVSANADLVQRMADEGHVIGSHSYYHPRLETCSPTRICIEAALVQKTLETAVDRSTKVMRLPYARGAGPLNSTQVAPIAELSKLGYVLVLGDIIPPDWTEMEPGDIVDFVTETTSNAQGAVLVMHDGGGDRANVVAALPEVISSLRARGFSFIGLPELLDAQQDDLIPPVTGERSWQDRMTFFMLDGLTGLLKISFWIVISIGLLRSLAMLIMAQVRRPHLTVRGDVYPRVDVLVPAYNEETVVAATIRAILATEYPNVGVIAVNDGSTDGTLAALEENFADHPRVRVLDKPNGGKSSALNHALSRSDAEIVVSIDADTLLHPKAIGLLARHFSDPHIGAVAGNVKVGNRKSVLTRFQALEYITAQNIDRRAAELVNGILVVPGAVGGWRRAAIDAAGGYPHDTLAEDADLTVAVNRAGYKVVYDPRAIAVTEAPETVGQLFRQRLRWTLGMMQVGWKHRGAVTEGRGVGFFALPDLLIFGVFMPLLAPLADIVFLAAAAGAVMTVAGGYGAAELAAVDWPILGAYFALPLFDFVVAALAFHFEPNERKSLLWLLLIQRFYYRQLLYITTIRAFLRALSGRVQGWQKLKRTSALVQDAPGEPPKAAHDYGSPTRS
jgi:cellulose synthase/poly-beta-1,6-N-acetylglucosamine synthase-like glycosyltransferase/peptidoglycan/xylan/chitin deacetylase (PgdA/CDA1 family)